MSTPSPVILIDDGELDDIRQLLAQLGVGYREETSVESAAGGAPCSLLITSARRTLASGNGGDTGVQPACKLHIVVYDTPSRTVRRMLAHSGCDVVIGRPIHPAVLRLLVSHALYSGPERRNLGRAAMAAPVKLRVDRRPRDATLVQLSLRGCGLAASQSVEVGREVEVIFPPELTGGEELSLAGEVLAAGPSASSAGRGRHLAVRFRSPHAVVRRILHEVMSRYALVATAKPVRPKAGRTERAPAEAPETPEAAPAVLADEGDEQTAPGEDQRSSPRKLFPRRVLAVAGGGTQVLIGRDLSAGGMRVRPVPGLQLGDEFKLALYGNGDQPALVLKAVVGRDDGWDGLVLKFRDVGAEVAAKLERLVESLPVARASKGAGARAPGVVVSEIIERG
jgi:hypothetical protein